MRPGGMLLPRMLQPRMLVLLVSVAFFVEHASAIEEIYFKENPEDITAIAGQSVTLSCRVEPGDDVVYTWELDGRPVENTTRRHQRNAGRELHIARVDLERDSGPFACIAKQTKTGHSISSRSARISVNYIESAWIQLQSQKVERNKEIAFKCHVKASGDVKFEWFKNSQRLAGKSKHLVIKDAQTTDSGTYRCTAQNEAGKVKSPGFVLSVPGESNEVVDLNPTDIIKEKNGTVRIDCYANTENNPFPIEWYMNDQGPLLNTSRLSSFLNGSLVIRHVQLEDEGAYSCVIPSGEKSLSFSAELKVAYLNELTRSHFEPELSENMTLVVPLGGFLQQTCLPPNSLPEAKLFWRDNKNVLVSDSGVVRVDDGRLIIAKARNSDAGVYTCYAENIAGKTKLSFKLIVSERPVIVTHPSSITVPENSRAVLKCKVDSMPPPLTTVKWYKDGKFLDTSRISRVKVSNETLVISPTMDLDRGEYRCEAHTIGFAPVASKTATISIIETLKFFPTPSATKRLELDSVAKIHCRAQGSPPPLVRWVRVGHQRLPQHASDHNGTLVFDKVRKEDRGRYTCIAENSQGVINATVKVEIVVAPKFAADSPNVYEVSEGFSIMIDCAAEGDPKPTIQWDKNSQMNNFDVGRFETMENGSLYLNEAHLDDDDMYGCTAGNSAGLTRKEIRLIVNSGENPKLSSNDEPEDDGKMITKAIIVTMSIATAYILLVVSLMIWCRRRRRSKLALNNTDENIEYDPLEQTEMKDCANGHLAAGTSNEIIELRHREDQRSEGAETPHSQSSNQSKRAKSTYDNLSLPRESLRELKLVGRGEFGDVMVAKLPQVNGDKRLSAGIRDVPVMIKILTNTKDEAAVGEFRREIDMLRKMSHDNVVKLIGLCREEEPHYMILEYTDWGDLKQFLMATRPGGKTASLNAAQSTALIRQIAQGMDHLASRRLVHKDLATRNCLLTQALSPKVGIVRMTRDPYSAEYCKRLNQIIPIRWMPYEAVYEDEYSTKSDVYSFGVLIWEVFNLAEMPYPKLNDATLLSLLGEKKLVLKPMKLLPDGIQTLQNACMSSDINERPAFSSIVQTLSDILCSL